MPTIVAPTEAATVQTRRLIDLAVVLIGAAFTGAALAGLPLFGDGAYYFFRLALDGEPLVANLRVGAVLAQLPVLVAWRLTDDPLLLRHAFAFGYAALPWLSLLVCWLLVRRHAPALVLFPILELVALQLNFSAVSELLLTLHWSWPFVLAALVWPERAATRVYGWLLAALLVVLHPLAFAAAAWLALLAGWIAWGATGWLRRRWQMLAIGFAIAALVRLVWTTLGSNAYERANLAGDAAVRYLLPEGRVQLGLIGLCGLLGVVWATLWWLRRDATGCEPASPAGRAISGPRPGSRERWLGRALLVLAWALPVLAALIGVGFLEGEGIRLKVALTYPLGLGLMGLAVLAWRPAHKRVGTQPCPPKALPPAAVLTHGVALATSAIVILALTRSAAWWTATHGLANLTAADSRACIPYGSQTPYALQWPWMAIIDNWAVPLNALAFRGDPALGPVALVLSGDGCERLNATGVVHFNGWITDSFAVIDARFGPLRRPKDLVPRPSSLVPVP